VAAPTSYSDAALAAFMVVELGAGTPGDGVAGVLGWVPGSPRVEYAVHAVARVFNVSDVATVTNMAALEAVARLSIWRAAEAALVVAYDYTTEGQSSKLDQLWQHAKAMVARYEGQCAALGVDVGTGGGMVTIHAVTRSEDPYAQPAASGAEF
jgi:hypothetical protein